MDIDLDDDSDDDEAEEDELIDFGDELQVSLSDQELILQKLGEDEIPPEDLFDQVQEENLMQSDDDIEM